MQVLAPYISCVVTSNEFADAIAQGFKEIYIIGTEGIMKHHVLRGENRFVRLKVDKIPNFAEVKIAEALNFLPAGKIPYELYEQVLGFFRKVMVMQNSEVEAMIHILWNKEQGYHLGVPPQTVSKASVSYDWSYIPAGTSIIVDIHSHNTMGAFFSGTDNNDDRNNISFSGVFGHLKNREPQTIWRFNYFAQKFDAKVENLFDLPVLPETEVPAEWLDQIKIKTYTNHYAGTGMGFTGNRIPQIGGGSSNLGNVPGAVKTGDGRTLNQVAAWQYPRSNQNVSDEKRANNQDDMIGSTFFNHETEWEKELEEYYRNMGIEPMAKPSSRSVRAGPMQGQVTPSATLFGMNEDHALGVQERAFVNLHEDTLLHEEESHLGKFMGEPVNFSNVLGMDEEDPVGGPSENGELYEQVHAIHGTDVADSWYAIDQEMGALNGKNELVMGLMSDMFEMISESEQPKLIRKFFQNLSPRQQEHIQQNGL
jgi:PRTRC genetic system protein A